MGLSSSRDYENAGDSYAYDAPEGYDNFDNYDNSFRDGDVLFGSIPTSEMYKDTAMTREDLRDMLWVNWTALPVLDPNACLHLLFCDSLLYCQGFVVAPVSLVFLSIFVGAGFAAMRVYVYVSNEYAVGDNIDKVSTFIDPDATVT